MLLPRIRKAPEYREERVKSIGEFGELGFYIRMVAQKKYPSLIVTGKAGTGKSHKVLSELNRQEVNYARLVSYTTPLSLYNWIHEHKDKLMVIDDVEGLLSNRSALSIFKSILWNVTGTRIVEYHTTSKRRIAPERFIVTGGVILICNRIPRLWAEHIEATISRPFFYEHRLSGAEYIQIVMKMIKLGRVNEPNSLLKYILKLPSRDLRNVKKLMLVMKEAKEDWKRYADKLMNPTVEIDEDVLVEQLDKTNLSVDEQFEKYFNETGRSRRSFQRARKKLMRS